MDVVNGLKGAGQVALQTLTILTAALVTLGITQSDYGQQLCILISLIQVYFAVPDQVFGILFATVLAHSGPPREPDFKTTERELALAREKESTTIRQKLISCRKVLKNIKEMAPVLKQGNTSEILIEIIIRKELIQCLEMLASGDLCILFEDIFSCESIRQVLQKRADENPYLKFDIVSLLNNKWNTSVDFRDAMQNLFAIKDKLEGSCQKGFGHDIEALKATTMILSGSAFGSAVLPSQSMTHLEPSAGF